MDSFRFPPAWAFCQSGDVEEHPTTKTQSCASDDASSHEEQQPQEQPEVLESKRSQVSWTERSCGQPKPQGRVHPELQQVESPVHDVSSLRRYLLPSADDPLANWQTPHVQDMDVCDLKSWFPSDNHVAFYTPARRDNNSYGSNPGLQYEQLSYRQLHQEINQCPPFDNSITSAANEEINVAIVLPTEHMAHMALALLSTIAAGAVAVPLDPRMPTMRILEAMEQLQCACLVASESFLLEGALPILERQSGTYMTHKRLIVECLKSDDTPRSRLVEYLNGHVEEIRLVSFGVCGRLEWTVLERVRDENSIDDHTMVWKPRNLQKSSGCHDDSIESTNQRIRSPKSTAMLLRTSGTTNKPKVVPIALSMLSYAGISIATALQLKRNDCNCNSMPFYHIGGIACNLLAVLVSGGSVILAGPLTDPNIFLDHLLSSPGKQITPTWYYAGPSMHKAIVLMAEARLEASNASLPNQLRFIRSASAHLNHDLALRLSKAFQCQVIPTYGMSEAMPICSSAPIDVRNTPPCEVIDSVGYSVGTSIRILDPETDEVLPYGTEKVGEISVKGAGVISNYVGLDVSKTHTIDGWLKTGDRGLLDEEGRLFIKGRSKEMIKRGGEQVFPNEIDDVVERVRGVATAVTFGVPNELWGEEVAVAVMLQNAHAIENEAYLQKLEEKIMEACRSKLDSLSMPQQIKFVHSTDALLKGSTGKYIRSKMADHLNVTAVDTGALKVLKTIGQIKAGTAAKASTAIGNEIEENLNGKWGWLESVREDGRRVIPSGALNGVRFLAACFVIQVHIGLYPNLPWVKLQAYQPNMLIFFGIGAFQTTCSIARSVKGQWASFVGSKVGSLHTLFVLSQLVNFPAFVLFEAFDDNGNTTWSLTKWIGFSLLFLFATITGMGHGFDVNKYTWFQSTFYAFLMLFPFMDDFLRRQKLKIQGLILLLAGIVAFGLWGLLYLVVPSDIFWGPLYPTGWSIVTWLPMLVCGMMAAYIFQWVAEYYQGKRDEELEERKQTPPVSDDPGTLLVDDVRDYSKVWGIVCDCCSVLLFFAAVAVALSPNCLCVYGDTFEAMRPGESLPEEECKFSSGREDYVWACGITYTEFADFIQPDPHHKEYGRFPTNFGGAFGYLRMAAPLMLLWIASMAFGNGYTARLFSSKVMTVLAPLGYPVYLLHIAVARYYWLATRGFEREHWFDISGEYPFPVEWYEVFIILCITIALGFFINSVLVPPLMPYSISLGVKVCTFVSSCFARCRFNRTEGHLCQQEPFDGAVKESTYAQVRKMVRGLTGVDVNRSIKLRYLGLDSLGATALLGMLHASVPAAAAKKLTLQQLRECETVGCLSDLLEDSTASRSSASSSEDDEDGRP